MRTSRRFVIHIEERYSPRFKPAKNDLVTFPERRNVMLKAGTEPPEFLGQTLQYKTTVGPYGSEYGVAPYYELHVWAWRHNPNGIFADWNPRVTCPTQ